MRTITKEVKIELKTRELTEEEFKAFMNLVGSMSIEKMDSFISHEDTMILVKLWNIEKSKEYENANRL